MIRLYSIGKALHPRHVFRISRASRARVDNVFLVLEQDGAMGYGEASPNAFFGEDAGSVQLALWGAADFFRRQTLRDAGDIERIWNEIWERFSPSRAAQCAVDLALWDLHSKLLGKTVCETALGKPARPVATSATLGICPREEWPARIAELRGFPCVKVKLAAQWDNALLAAIRAQGPAIRVDANCAWDGLDLAHIVAIASDLQRAGVEFIEQPLPPAQDARMPAVLERSALPIFADESCASPADLDRLPGRFTGFNIKLVKCGGITPALAMLRQGRALGLQSMIGCMLESSLLISAGAVAAQDADYADLDGAWLLADDPFEGLEIKQGRIHLGSTPGLGVSPKPPRD